MTEEFRPPLPEDGPIVIEIDPDLMDLLDIFLETRHQDVAALKVAVSTGDHDTIRDLGHRMKGVGGGYGFDYVTTVGAALEELAKAGDLTSTERWIAGLEDYLRRVKPVEGPEEL